MTLPVNFDSMGVDAILADWVCALQEQGVDAVVVLGPVPTGTREQREVLAVHPPRFVGAAQALAESTDFGAGWRDSDAPLVAWQDISKSALEQSEMYGPGGPLNLLVQQLENGVALERPVTPAYPVITTAFAEAMDNIRNGADVKAELDKAVQIIDQNIKDNDGFPIQ